MDPMGNDQFCFQVPKRNTSLKSMPSNATYSVATRISDKNLIRFLKVSPTTVFTMLIGLFDIIEIQKVGW